MNLPKHLLAALCLIPLVVPVMAQTHSHSQHTSEHHPGAASDVISKEFAETDAVMMRKMAVPYTGDVEMDFRTHMIPHHQGGIDMAKIALKHTNDPETRRLAQRIIDAQQAEISEMQAWLARHGR